MEFLKLSKYCVLVVIVCFEVCFIRMKIMINVRIECMIEIVYVIMVFVGFEFMWNLVFFDF